MAPNSQAKLAAKGSPLRKGATTKLTSKNNKGARFVIESFGFPPTGVEAFSYTRLVDDNVYEGYTYPFRQFIEGTTDNEVIKDTLQKGNFMACYYQRIDGYDNERKVGSDNWPRYWMIRNLEGGHSSTEASRLEGMELLRTLFKDKTVSKYPPQDIMLRDRTGNPPAPMNRFFLDGDIIALMETIIDEELLNVRFAVEFPLFASVMFSGPNYPIEAVDRLGFGPQNPQNGRNGNYAPGFVPPPVNNVSNEPNGDNDGSNDSDNDTEDKNETGKKKSTRGSGKKKG